MLSKTRFPILAALLSLSVATPTLAMAEDQCDESDIYLAVDMSTKSFYLVDAAGNLAALTEGSLAIGFGDSLSTVTLHLSLHPSMTQGEWWFDVWEIDAMTREKTGYQSDSTGHVTVTLDRPADDLSSLYFYLGDIVQSVNTTPDDSNPLTVPDLVISPQTGCPEDEFMSAEAR